MTLNQLHLHVLAIINVLLTIQCKPGCEIENLAKFYFDLKHGQNMDHVSYSVPRPMHRSIYRSLLDRPSTDTRLTCRSTFDRESTDVSVELPLMSAEVSTVTISGAYRSTTGRVSVNYRRNVGRVSFDSRARVYRYNLPIYRPILSVIIDTIDRYLILSTDVSTNVSADISTDTRVFIDRSCVGRVSTNVSTDISTDIH